MGSKRTPQFKKRISLTDETVLADPSDITPKSTEEKRMSDELPEIDPTDPDNQFDAAVEAADAAFARGERPDGWTQDDEDYLAHSSGEADEADDDIENDDGRNDDNEDDIDEPDDQRPTSIECRDCDGTGFDPLVGDGAQCTRCYGTGEIDNPY